MGIWESALILLGIGIVSQRFKAGVGLGELGLGIRELAAAPLGGIGTGMGEFGTGLRTFAESLGDIGRGFGTLFENIPQLPGYVGPGGSGSGELSPDAGGSGSDQQPGGGGNVPPSGVQTWRTMDVEGLGILGGKYFWAPSPENGYTVWAA